MKHLIFSSFFANYNVPIKHWFRRDADSASYLGSNILRDS